MGIKYFSQVFKADKEVKFSEITREIVAVDAMNEIYRAALGASSVGILTDKDGNPTIHLSVILTNIIAFTRQKCDIIYVFDAPSDGDVHHNPQKIDELVRRNNVKLAAQKKLDALNSASASSSATKKVVVNPNDNMFSDSDNSDEGDSDREKLSAEDKKLIAAIDKSEQIADSAKQKLTKNMLEKQVFKINAEHIADVKFMLDCLCIPWIESPQGFEAEAICAWLTKDHIGKCTAVYSGDSDTLVFGATNLYRKVHGKIYHYTLKNVLKQIGKGLVKKDKETSEKSKKSDTLATKTTKPTITMNDLWKVAAVLGNDLSKKTPGIGPKTVFAKYRSVELTKEQVDAVKQFQREPAKSDIIIHNKGMQAFSSEDNIKKLIDWMVVIKNFNRLRLETMIKKVTE